MGRRGWALGSGGEAQAAAVAGEPKAGGRVWADDGNNNPGRSEARPEFGAGDEARGLGGIHQGNLAYNPATSFTGLYAPTVTSVTGQPVVLHNIAASGSAVPYLYFGAPAPVQVKIAGGSLAQPNGDNLTVGGLAKVTMGAGQDSCGRGAPAQPLATRLLTPDGSDVTSTVVTGP